MSTPASGTLADRYGVRPSRRFPWTKTIVITIFALGVVFIGYLTLGGRDSSPVSKDLSFNIIDASKTDVTVSVVPDDKHTVHCALQALNSQFGVVGYREVAVPPAPDGKAGEAVVIQQTIRTTQLAVNGGIDKCWFGNADS